MTGGDHAVDGGDGGPRVERARRGRRFGGLLLCDEDGGACDQAARTTAARAA